ncbi:MAG TPA: hypothetical protein VKB96_03355 [Gammaproteobacteria bacterium]|nr:hypothetical protein [Gammaproteobacteria bacterium]
MSAGQAHAGATLTDTLPVGVTWVSAFPSCGPPVGSVVVCQLKGLGSGDSIFVALKVTPTAPGTLSNTAPLSANEADPNSLNNTDPEQTLVHVTCNGLTPTRVGVTHSTAAPSRMSATAALRARVTPRSIARPSRTCLELYAGE